MPGDEENPLGRRALRPPPLASTRTGGVGGTAALWTAELAHGQLGARYAPLAPIDFEAREDIPWSGWPFGRAHLEPFYASAWELCRAGPFERSKACKLIACVAFCSVSRWSSRRT